MHTKQNLGHLLTMEIMRLKLKPLIPSGKHNHFGLAEQGFSQAVREEGLASRRSENAKSKGVMKLISFLLL